MSRRLLIGLLLLAGVLGSAYQWRKQLLFSAIDASFARAEFQLLQLEGLNIGWHSVAVEKLLLAQSGTGDVQSLEGVTLRYSLLDARALSLSVERLVWSVAPDDNRTPEKFLLFSELLEQLMSAPVESIHIAKLELPQVDYPLFSRVIELNFARQEGRASIDLNDGDHQLKMDLKRASENTLSLILNLPDRPEPAVFFQASFAEGPKGLSITGSGKFYVEPLMPLFKTLGDLPDGIVAVTGDIVFDANFTLKDRLDLISQAKGELKILPESALDLQIVQDKYRPKIQFGFPEPLIISFTEGAIATKMESKCLTWTLQDQTSSVRSSGRFTQIQCSTATSLYCESSVEFKLSAAVLQLDGEQEFGMSDLNVTLAAEIKLEDNQLQATLKSGEWLKAGAVAQGELQWSGPVLRTGSDARINYSLTSQSLHFQLPNAQLLLPRVQLGGLAVASVLELGELKISRNESGDFAGAAQLRSGAVNVQTPDMWLPVLAFDSEVGFQGNKLTFEGQFEAGGRLHLATVSASYRIDINSGRAHVYNDSLQFDGNKKRLSRHFSRWPFKWDVLAGSVALDANIKWQTPKGNIEYSGNIKHSVNDLALVYNKLGFVGVNGNVAFEIGPTGSLFTPQEGRLSIETLDVGVPLQELKARFLVDSKKQQLTVESGRARLFGGEIWLEDAIYRHGRAHNKIYIGVDGIQLGQLLDLAGYDAIEATGTISGLLPLDLNIAGVTMQRGMLAAKSPGGVFRYKGDISSDVSPTMLPVLTALENYQYSVFQLEADYLEGGELQMSMSFQGSNPDVQNGRPIHLNLNVTDNIPSLLKSLQSGRTIADTIEKKLGGG